MDEHENHIQIDFIIYYIQNNINLLIMPLYCSHILQPLDIDVFTAFK